MPRRLLGKSLHCYGDHLGLIAAPLDSWRGRTQRGDMLIGTSLRQLKRRHGVELRGRTVDAHEHTVRFQDGRQLDVETVIWATGYRSDYSWIHAPVFDKQGTPTPPGGDRFPGSVLPWHETPVFARFFAHRLVKHDAAFIVDQVRADSTTEGPNRTTQT